VLAAVDGDPAFQADTHPAQGGAGFTPDGTAKTGYSDLRNGGGDYRADGNGNWNTVDAEADGHIFKFQVSSLKSQV
jgi:hypothetical protein